MFVVSGLVGLSLHLAAPHPRQTILHPALIDCGDDVARRGARMNCDGGRSVKVAMLLGRDEREDASSYFLPAQNTDQGVVGMIECGDAKVPGRSHQATGWLIGSRDTVVTAAHAFFPASATASVSSEQHLDPRACLFITFNADQSIREVIRIRYAVSDWSSHKHIYDSSYDIAVAKLDRPAAAADGQPIRAETDPRGAQVILVAFHTDVRAQLIPRITRGVIAKFPRKYVYIDEKGYGVTAGNRLFASSANSSPGSSGGIYIDAADKAAIGIHIGQICPDREGRYKPGSCFNYGLYFSPHVLDQIRAVVDDRPPASSLITRDVTS